MHGVARVMVKGYAEERFFELSRRREPGPSRADGDRGIRQLARDMVGFGLGGSVVARGKSPDGPVH